MEKALIRHITIRDAYIKAAASAPLCVLGPYAHAGHRCHNWERTARGVAKIEPQLRSTVCHRTSRHAECLTEPPATETAFSPRRALPDLVSGTVKLPAMSKQLRRRSRLRRVPGTFSSLEVQDPMGVWIATGALGRVRLLNHPLWRRPCKLQLTEPMRRPLSKQIFPQFLCLWNSADLPG